MEVTDEYEELVKMMLYTTYSNTYLPHSILQLNLCPHIKREASKGLSNSMANIIHKIATTETLDRNTIIFTYIS